MSGPEAAVERALVRGLEKHGFKVLKLVTPGTTGVPDRMVLMPKWSPGPPTFIECKAPGKELRALQVAIWADWVTRGVDILSFVNTVEAAGLTVRVLLNDALVRVGWTRDDYENHRQRGLQNGVR